MKLTAGHLRELRRIRDEGRSRSRTTQRAGLSEFVWKLRDGRLIGDSQVSENWYDEMQGAQNVGQRLTDAGRSVMRGAYFLWMWWWCWLCFKAYMTLPCSRSHSTLYGRTMLWFLGFAGMYAHSNTYEQFTNCNYFTDRIGL